MIVYLDILMIENFLVNLFLLTITLQTIRTKIKYKRLILSSFIGSFYVITIVDPTLIFFTKTPFKVLVAFLMCFISIKEKDKLMILKSTIIFILYSITLAGLCFYLSIKSGKNIVPNAMLYNFSYKKLILAIMIIYIIVYRVVTYIKDRKLMENYVYTINIYLDNTKSTIRALIDTGNELREPLTNLPVIIVERNALSDIKMSNYSEYVIPYSVINGDGGKLKAIRPDKIEIDIQGQKKEREVLLAFTDKRLSEHGEYSGLLPRGIIE